MSFCLKITTSIQLASVNLCGDWLRTGKWAFSSKEVLKKKAMEGLG